MAFSRVYMIYDDDIILTVNRDLQLSILHLDIFSALISIIVNINRYNSG